MGSTFLKQQSKDQQPIQPVKVNMKHRDMTLLSNKAKTDHVAESRDDWFNSMIPDQHVDEDAPKSMKEFNYVRDHVHEKQFLDIRVRGLKLVETEIKDVKMCMVEILCASEIGLVNALDLLKSIKSTHSFSYVRLMGDNFINIGTSKVPIGVQGFTALIQAFTTTNTFDMTTSFRFYNFQPEVTPLMSFVQILQNNLTLHTIGFAKNSLNDDACAGILQRLYYNQSLKCLDFNGNNFVSTEFLKKFLKPYFSSRGEDLNIILD